MINPIIYVRRLLSVRLSLWIVLFAALIFIGALKYLFTESKETVREEAINHANQILDNTVQRVNNILDRVEVATNNIDWLVTSHLNDPDAMYVYSRRILQNNPDLNGCSIAFEPYFFKERGLYYSVYSERRDGEIHSRQEGKEDYQYFSMDWYLLPQLLDRPCWTEPYIDLDPDSTYTKEMIVSYCKPLKDKDSTFVGVISTDISLSWLSQVISAVKPYPNSYSIMTGRGCTYLVHPDSTKLFYYTIFTETLKHPNAAVTDLGHAMHAGEDGMKQMVIDGKECYVFYKPLKKTDWSVAIVCPEDDIFGGFNRLRRAVSVIVMIGLLLMLYIVSLIITKELKPLRQLARQTKVIASGQFDGNLPDNGRIDEIGNLTQSFGDMQQSLMKYIDELKDTTAQKERIESELRIARDIQMSMVPAKFPKREGLDMFAMMEPAKEVGGDLYGYVINDDKLYFCVGDVSGKGVPASLFMAQATRLFRTLAAKGDMPTEICTHMNDALSGEDNKKSMFVTMFVGLVDLNTGHMKYCNAGHNAPLLGDDFMKMVINMPIGMMSGLSYKGDEIGNIKGKTLFIYSDGLNEALNKEKQLFGDDKLLEAYRSCRQESAKQIVETLVAEVVKHRDGAEPNDDLTMMCLKIN